MTIEHGLPVTTLPSYPNQVIDQTINNGIPVVDDFNPDIPGSGTDVKEIWANRLVNEVRKIQEELGTNPKSSHSDVKTRLSTMDSTISGKASSSHLHTGVYEPSNSNIQNHISSTLNPHSVTYSQVGASPSGHNHTLSSLSEKNYSSLSGIPSTFAPTSHGDESHSKTYMDLSSNQSIGGNKTFTNTIIGNISGNSATSDHALVADSLSISNISTEDINYYINSSTGNDNNDGSSGSPFQTLGKAIDIIPKILNHNVKLYLSNGTYNLTSIETDKLSKLLGNGNLEIEGIYELDNWNTTISLTSIITLMNINKVIFKNLKFESTISGIIPHFTFKNINNIEIDNINFGLLSGYNLIKIDNVIEINFLNKIIYDGIITIFLEVSNCNILSFNSNNVLYSNENIDNCIKANTFSKLNNINNILVNGIIKTSSINGTWNVSFSNISFSQKIGTINKGGNNNNFWGYFYNTLIVDNVDDNNFIIDNSNGIYIENSLYKTNSTTQSTNNRKFGKCTNFIKSINSNSFFTNIKLNDINDEINIYSSENCIDLDELSNINLYLCELYLNNIIFKNGIYKFKTTNLYIKGTIQNSILIKNAKIFIINKNYFYCNNINSDQGILLYNNSDILFFVESDAELTIWTVNNLNTILTSDKHVIINLNHTSSIQFISSNSGTSESIGTLRVRNGDGTITVNKNHISFIDNETRIIDES